MGFASDHIYNIFVTMHKLNIVSKVLSISDYELFRYSLKFKRYRHGKI